MWVPCKTNVGNFFAGVIMLLLNIRQSLPQQLPRTDVNYKGWISDSKFHKIKFAKKTRMPIPGISLGYIKWYSSSSPREDLKPYWKSENRPHFSRWSTSLLFTSFSKTLLTTERRLRGRYLLAVDLSPTF